MFVWWGPDLINVYNDAYAPMLGKRHPVALGQPARSIWADIWPDIGDDVQRVVRLGESVTKQRVRFLMERNGYPEETFFSYTHSPIPDDHGGIGGLIQVCTDETASVLAERERDRLAEQREKAEELATSILESVAEGFFSLDEEWRFTYANPQAGIILGRSIQSLIGHIIWEEYPGLYGSSFEPLYRRAMTERVSGAFDSYYPDHDCWYAVRCYPSRDGISVLFQNVTESKRAEAEREALIRTVENERSRLRAVIEQAPAFICTMVGPDHVYELANGPIYDLLGQRDLIGKPFREALPELAGQPFFDLLDRVYQTGEPFHGHEMPTQLARGTDGRLEQRFMNFVYQPLRQPSGEINGILCHGVDVTDGVLARREVAESEARFRQLADAMPQMVWVTRSDGHHEYYNRRWYEFTGVPNGSTDGEAWNGMFHPDDQERAWAAWRLSLATGDPYEVEYRLRHHSGEYRWTLGRALPIRDANGRVERWFGTCTDIDAIKGLERDREALLVSERAARATAEQAGRMKDEFLATLSHEIRTPLNAILGWSQIMRHSKDDADFAQGLDVIERNARAQSQIVEDLLDMSRIISGKVRLDVQRLDVSFIVRSAVESARPTAEAKSLRLQSVIDPLHGLAVSGDASRLQQVLWNLLSNAIKFTPKNGRVQVLLERVNSHIEISVIDTGEGIDPEFLPFVFDRFRQADASTTRRHGGLGLGLSIVKQLVELHGGSISVKSAGQAKGATFTVALPLIVAHPELKADVERRHPRIAPGTNASPSACDDIRGVRVLVVDDEADARALVKRLLEDCHAVVTAAGSAGEAVELIKTGRFDVLVSDIGMPNEDGYSLIRRVRRLAKENGRDIPAIALTAYARAEDRMKAVSAGFLMHVAKPVEPAELVTMVAGAAGRTGPGRE